MNTARCKVWGGIHYKPRTQYTHATSCMTGVVIGTRTSTTIVIGTVTIIVVLTSLLLLPTSFSMVLPLLVLPPLACWSDRGLPPRWRRGGADTAWIPLGRAQSLCLCGPAPPAHPRTHPPHLPPTPILQVYQQHDRTRRRKWDFSREGCDVGSGISPGVGSVVVTRAEAGRWEGGKGYGRGPGVQSRTGHDAHPTLRSCRTRAVPTLPQRCGNTTSTITDTGYRFYF